jgi:hypothetical protein
VNFCQNSQEKRKVMSGSRHSAKQQAIDASQRADKAIRAFLERELPPRQIKDALYLTNVLLQAALRYDRYSARRKEWMNYSIRRNRLVRVTESAEALASNLSKLDIISREDLASRADPEKVEALIGSLNFLSTQTADMAEEAQKSGRPRDLAEERWILELADIYENAFGKPARVWGSGDEKVSKRRGKFYHLLEVSRPSSFPRYGKLSLRQIQRTLRLRSKRKNPLEGLIQLSGDRDKPSPDLKELGDLSAVQPPAQTLVDKLRSMAQQKKAAEEK